MNADDTISLTRTTDLAFGEPGQMVTIPRQVGPVRLERQIGQGAMGVVWLGTDEMLQRKVAVKFLLTAVQGPEDPRLLAFLEGARAAAALRHGSLTNILQADSVENIPYLVMEYIDGPSLSSLIRTTDPLSPPELLAVMTDVCSAVGHLHEQQRIHRDIKPSNILIDRDGNAFVTDFGLSRELSARQGVLREEGGASIAGTPAYMAPEMFEGQISAKSDVYALGITAFELLCGKAPFAGTLDEIRDKHATEPPPLDRLRALNVSEPLIEAIERAVNKSPMFRHKSPTHFFAALEPACGGPAMVSRGRQALFDRLLRLQNAAPDAPAPGSGSAPVGAPPLTPGQTYYDRLTIIAEQKRKEDSKIALEDAAEPARKQPETHPEAASLNPVLFGPQDPEYPVWPLITGLILAAAGGLQAIIGPVAMIGLVSRPTGGPFSSRTPTTEPSALWTTFGWAGTLIAFLFGITLIVTGVGFMMQGPWSIRVARVWGWSKLIFAFIAAALVYFAATRTGAVSTTEDTSAVIAIAVFGWEVLPPLLLLGWLATPAARAQTAAWSQPGGHI